MLIWLRGGQIALYVFFFFLKETNIQSTHYLHQCLVLLTEHQDYWLFSIVEKGSHPAGQNRPTTHILVSASCGPGEEELESAAAEEAPEEVAVVEEEAPAASDGEAEVVVEAVAEAVTEAAEVVAEAAQEVETVAEEVAESVEEAAQAVAAEEPDHNGTTSSSEEGAGVTEA